MRKHRKAVIATACLLAANLMALWLSRDKEPSYSGYTLTQWLDVEAQRMEPPGDFPYPTFTEAVHSMGTNAIPHLLRRIEGCEKPPTPPERLIAWLPKRIRPDGAYSDPAQKRLLRGFAAQHALELLGPIAAPAIPALEKIANGPGYRPPQCAVIALGSLGPEARSALARLASQGTNVNSAVYARNWFRFASLPLSFTNAPAR